MAKLSLNDLKDFRGKTFFVRVDYNVPLDDAGAITESQGGVPAHATVRYYDNN